MAIYLLPILDKELIVVNALGQMVESISSKVKKLLDVSAIKVASILFQQLNESDKKVVGTFVKINDSISFIIKALIVRPQELRPKPVMVPKQTELIKELCSKKASAVFEM
ncbi:MAG: hypothetical protein R2728_05365 [Chitinophagales bacterium]